MSRKRTKGGFSLSFAAVDCGCGQQRVCGVSCDDCGERPRPHEFDIRKKRRSTLASALHTVEADSNFALPGVGVEPLKDVCDEIDGWHETLFRLLDQAEPSPDDLVAHIRTLLNLRLGLSRVERLRPWRELYSRGDDLFGTIWDLLSISLDIYGANTPKIAQRLEIKMREAVVKIGQIEDQLLASIGGLGALVESGSPEDQLMLAASMSFSGGETRARSAALWKDVAPNATFLGGVEFLATCFQLTDLLGESAEFEQKLRDVVAVLRQDTQRCVATITSPEFVTNFSRSCGDSYRSATMLHLINVANGNERIALDSVMDSLHAITETGTRHSLALVASALTSLGYSDWFKGGANKCIRAVAASQYSGLVDGLSIDVRNAKAHRAYVASGDGVDILDNGGHFKLHIDGPHLVDMAICVNVAYLALTLGVVIFASEEGIDAKPLIESSEVLPPLNQMKLTAMVTGWPHVIIEPPVDNSIQVTNCPEVHVTLNIKKIRNLVTALTIARFAPPNIPSVMFHDGGSRPLIVDTKAAKSFFERVSSDAILETARVFRHVRRGDELAISANEWKNLVLSNAASVIDQPYAASVYRARQFRSLALESGESGIAEELTNMLRLLRGREMGLAESIPSLIARTPIDRDRVVQYPSIQDCSK